MVSIQVSKGQGLTQALQTYAKNNGYDVSGIDKKDWENTIFKLEKIQDSREKNNETSYDEFEAYEVKHTKDNAENESEADADIEAAKASLKTIFNHLNVDTESSKDDLDKEEIMNYFFSMDSLDSEKYTADGYVSQNSYIKMQNALADDENVEQKDKDGNVIKKDDRQGNMIFEFLKRNYNEYFKKLK